MLKPLNWKHTALERESTTMTDKNIPVKEGQHYEHNRGQIYTIDYMNDDIVLLYDGSNYRMEQVDYFKSVVSTGMFELRPDLRINDSEVEIDFEEIDWVGESAIESLNKSGFTTPKDFEYKTDERILEMTDSLGKKGLSNIKEYINNKPVDTVNI